MHCGFLGGEHRHTDATSANCYPMAMTFTQVPRVSSWRVCSSTSRSRLCSVFNSTLSESRRTVTAHVATHARVAHSFARGPCLLRLDLQAQLLPVPATTDTPNSHTPTPRCLASSLSHECGKPQHTAVARCRRARKLHLALAATSRSR
jgi:hypothetical protein